MAAAKPEYDASALGSTKGEGEGITLLYDDSYYSSFKDLKKKTFTN